MNFTVKDKKYTVDFGEENQALKYKKEISIVRAIDKSQISHNSYRNLAAIEISLLREQAIFKQRTIINDLIKQKINISIVDITTTAIVDSDELSHIVNE